MCLGKGGGGWTDRCAWAKGGWTDRCAWAKGLSGHSFLSSSLRACIDRDEHADRIGSSVARQMATL
eukprot:130892-Chlamydomonas_euryale.AAC.10